MPIASNPLASSASKPLASFFPKRVVDRILNFLPDQDGYREYYTRLVYATLEKRENQRERVVTLIKEYLEE